MQRTRSGIVIMRLQSLPLVSTPQTLKVASSRSGVLCMHPPALCLHRLRPLSESYCKWPLRQTYLLHCDQHGPSCSSDKELGRRAEDKDSQFMAKLLPTHIRPPLPNAQNHLSFFSVSPGNCSSHRFGIHSPDLGNACSLRCSEYA